MMLAAWLVALVLARQGDPWPQIWSELETLRGGTASPAEAGALREHLTAASRAGPEDPRGELLRAALESIAGHDVSAMAGRLASLRPSPYGAREQWFLADLLPLGPERTRAILAALESPAAPTRWQFFLAWNTAVDDARAMRYAESTLPIQLRLNERYQADWSALDLTLTYKALGEWSRAESVLEQAIQREESAGRRPFNLWDQRGILALGAGDEPRARDYLGKAMALGSNDAGLVLSRLDLMQGRPEAARRGFRALLFDQPPPDWAWRGWGMALLPTAPNE